MIIKTLIRTVRRSAGTGDERGPLSPCPPAGTPAAAADARQPLTSTRRGFLRVGSASVAGAAIGAHSLSTLAERAEAASVDYQLHINAGDVRMIDGNSCFVRRFGAKADDLAFPGPGVVLRAKEGDRVNVHITNNLSEPHAFEVRAVVRSAPIAPGATASIGFTAPSAGTYLYQDAIDPDVNRVLGLHGVLVVEPAGSATPAVIAHAGGGQWRFTREYIWVLHGFDPVWAGRARRGEPIAAGTAKPRYFTINNRSGVESCHAEDTQARGYEGEPALIRMVNASPAVHSPHFHGNHVVVLAENGRVLDVQMYKDQVRMEPGHAKDVLLPFKRPPDAMSRQETDWRYPMHCHTELSQTCTGGLYPSGMITDWVLLHRAS